MAEYVWEYKLESREQFLEGKIWFLRSFFNMYLLYISELFKKFLSWVVVAHSFYPSTQEAEAGKSQQHQSGIKSSSKAMVIQRPQTLPWKKKKIYEAVIRPSIVNNKNKLFYL